MKEIIYYGSLVLFLVAGAAIWWIGRRPSARQAQKFRALTMGLWGFEPEQESAQLKDNNIWNWRKLVWAGVLVASVSTFTVSRKINPVTCAAIGAAIFIVWYIFLLFFWYFAIVASPEKANSKVNQPSAGGEDMTPSAGWIAKTKSSDGDNRLPLTVITGFLGSGKTTLVKHLLSNTKGMKILVVENEIGQEGIDHELLLQQTQKENIILMNNGCVCCTVRGDLIATFHELFKSDSLAKIDWVVIETTGLADPAPVIQSLYMDPQCNKAMRLDGVIAVVDCKHVMTHIDSADKGLSGAHGPKSVPEAVQQIAFADRVLLNKTDLVDSEGLEAAKEAVRLINPEVRIVTSVQSQAPVEELLNIKAFDATRNESLLKQTHIGPERDISISRGVFHIETDAEGKIVQQKRKKKSRGVLRMEETERSGGNGAVSTVSLVSSAPIDLNAFNVWMASLLQDKGNDLYRFKGILSMEGYDEQFVVQGIHMLFNGERGPLWSVPEGQRRSRLVFIGVRLPEEELRKGFQACMSAQHSSGEEKKDGSQKKTN